MPDSLGVWAGVFVVVRMLLVRHWRDDGGVGLLLAYVISFGALHWMTPAYICCPGGTAACRWRRWLRESTIALIADGRAEIPRGFCVRRSRRCSAADADQPIPPPLRRRRWRASSRPPRGGRRDVSGRVAAGERRIQSHGARIGRIHSRAGRHRSQVLERLGGRPPGDRAAVDCDEHAAAVARSCRAFSASLRDAHRLLVRRQLLPAAGKIIVAGSSSAISACRYP